MKCTCKQCGKEFEISASEIEFYESKNLSIPKRCKDCRIKNKKKYRPYKKKAKPETAAEEKPVKQDNKVQEVKKAIEQADEIVKTVTGSEAPKKKGLKAVISIIVVAVLAVAGVFFGPLGGGHQDEAYDSSVDNTTASVQVEQDADASTVTEYEFRNEELKESHFEKHGIEMGFSTADEYEDAAEAVINNVNALHKTEAEDGDDVYYLQDSNEFVIVSTDGYIRTYFEPSGGMAYYEKQ